jgi:acyl-CoA reductase-like NAD-dependent aldehyde dehydrogenase
MTLLKVHAPFDGQELASLPFMSEEAIELAIAEAQKLFFDRSRRLPLHRRIDILRQAAHLIEERFQEFVRTATAEGGKPWADSEVEVLRGLNGIDAAVATLYQLGGSEVPMGITAATAGRYAATIREPAGLVLAISAFNHPFNLIVHQVVPCIAVGCPVLIKPALSTPLTCRALVDLFHEAGLPSGWCQMILCPDSQTAKLARDKRLSFVSFIGSATVGWKIRSELAAGVRCQLEHGGTAPVIVLEDADISTLIPLMVKGGFYHAGQVCVSVQRLFVHASLFDEVAAGLVGAVEKLKIGDPLSKSTEVGPLIRRSEVDRLEKWVREAGGVLAGGKRLSDSCFAPTLLANPPADALVSTREIFGPVICLYSCESREIALGQANALPYSFQAAVFGNQLDAILDTVQRLKAATVLVNDHTAFRADWMPFGGREESGLGMGGIPYTMRDLTPEKLVVIRSAALS